MYVTYLLVLLENTDLSVLFSNEKLNKLVLLNDKLVFACSDQTPDNWLTEYFQSVPHITCYCGLQPNSETTHKS